jgi:hypothetical protein
MTFTSEFLADPERFLETHVVIVPHTVDKAAAGFGIRAFKLTKKQNNVVGLEIALPHEDHFPAYYLPWKIDIATTADLGKDADYFFTSQLTNCRFSVLDVTDSHKPKVAHVAGNDGSSIKRNKMEAEAGFLDPGKRVRRLSISQSMDKRSERKRHDYAGTSVKDDIRSSAFVYGLRDDVSGWRFAAQIVKGDMSGPLTGDVTILQHAYQI